MIFGADYYPEHWDRSEWKEHAVLMRRANMNTVRLAEFSWRLLEPCEGVFDFAWLDEAIEVLVSEGIKVILGTPTAAPPKWLANKHDIYMRDKYGRARGFGARRESCANNPYYRERSRIIVEKMAEHYADNPNVIAWQIDNEFGCHASTLCYCDHCRRAFGEYLSKKFADIDELNRTYGTVFWSHQYDGFDDVILPGYTSCDSPYGENLNHNPALELDFKRFSSDTWIGFAKEQTAVIRKYSSLPITHNLMGHFSDIDYYKLAENLDVVSWDNYPDNQWGSSEHEYVSMAHELMRGAKGKNFWVMEEQAGPAGWDTFGGTPRPGEIRLWTYQAIAHGADGMVYFRFKSALFGMEQYWLGILDHDGIPRRRYYEVQKIGEELGRLGDLIEGAEPAADVLLVKSYEDLWSHAIKRHVKKFSYEDVLYRYFRANIRLGANIVCGRATDISDKYKVVYVPACVIVSDEEREILEKYVSEGGTLVLTYRSGLKDEHNNMLPITVPGPLRRLAGVTAQEFDSSELDVPLTNGFGSSHCWRDMIVTETAEPISEYDGEFYKGSPAVTVNRFGKGKVYYVGCDLGDVALIKLARLVAEELGAEYIPHPADTEIVKKVATDGTVYRLLLNFAAEPRQINIKGTSLMGGGRFDGTLPAYGVEIIKEILM